MSSPRKTKKVIVSKKTQSGEKAQVRRAATADALANKEMVLGRQNYYIILIGVVLIGLGLLLMSGGHMPDENTWDENIIYSFRRVTLAPIVIILGLVVEIYGIFK
jgi:sulfite exporter TauE/SafE